MWFDVVDFGQGLTSLRLDAPQLCVSGGLCRKPCATSLDFVMAGGAQRRKQAARNRQAQRCLFHVEVCFRALTYCPSIGAFHYDIVLHLLSRASLFVYLLLGRLLNNPRYRSLVAFVCRCHSVYFVASRRLVWRATFICSSCGFHVVVSYKQRACVHRELKIYWQ